MKRILSFLVASAISLSLFAVAPANAAQSVIKDIGDRSVAIDEYEMSIEEFMMHPVCPEGMETLGLTLRLSLPESIGNLGFGDEDSYFSYRAIVNIDMNDETCATIANMDLSLEDIYDTNLKGVLTLLQVALDVKMERYEWTESGDIYRYDVLFALPAYVLTEDSAPVAGKTYYERYYDSWYDEEYYDEAEYLDFSEYDYYERILIAPNFSKDIDPSKDYYFVDLLSSGGGLDEITVNKIKNPSDKIALFLGLEMQEEEVLKKSYVGNSNLNKFPLRPFEGKMLDGGRDMGDIYIWPEDLSQVATINGKTYLFFTYDSYWEDPLFGEIDAFNSITVACDMDGKFVEVPTTEDEVTYAVLPFLENGFLAGIISVEELYNSDWGYYYDRTETRMLFLDSEMTPVHEWDNVLLMSEISGSSKKGDYGLYGYFSNVEDLFGGEGSSLAKINIMKISLLNNETAPETFDGLAGHIFFGATGLLGLGLILTINRRMNKI